MACPFHGVLGTLRAAQKVAMAMTAKTNSLEKVPPVQGIILKYAYSTYFRPA
jgi:hypothetical protein